MKLLSEVVMQEGWLIESNNDGVTGRREIRNRWLDRRTHAASMQLPPLHLQLLALAVALTRVHALRVTPCQGAGGWLDRRVRPRSRLSSA